MSTKCFSIPKCLGIPVSREVVRKAGFWSRPRLPSLDSCSRMLLGSPASVPGCRGSLVSTPKEDLPHPTGSATTPPTLQKPGLRLSFPCTRPCAGMCSGQEEANSRAGILTCVDSQTSEARARGIAEDGSVPQKESVICLGSYSKLDTLWALAPRNPGRGPLFLSPRVPTTLSFPKNNTLPLSRKSPG